MRRALLLATLLVAAGPASALGPVAFGPDLEAEGWRTIDFRGRAPAAFRAEGAAGLGVRAERGVSVLYRSLPPAFAAAAAADWRWRVTSDVPPTDLAQRGGDDRALAVYFLFADDAAATLDPPRSLAAALRRGRALLYVWGGDAGAGRIIASPHMHGRGQMVVRRPAGSSTGSWVVEHAELRADFRRAFGRESGPLVGVAVSSDSDDTGGLVEAAIADLVLR